MDMNDGMISFHIRVSKKILNPSPESSWQTTKKTNHLRHVYISAVNGALKTFLSRPSSLEPWELGRELRYENKVDGNTRTSFPNPSSRLARWSFGAGFLRESAACAAAADRPCGGVLLPIFCSSFLAEDVSTSFSGGSLALSVFVI